MFDKTVKVCTFISVTFLIAVNAELSELAMPESGMSHSQSRGGV